MPKAINRDNFAYVTEEAWRVLVAVEMGMKNHEVVPLELLQKIAHCRRSSAGILSILKDQLVPNSLVAFEVDQRHSYRGYRLTNLGYDYLALNAMVKSEKISDVGAMIGSGKESDVYLAVAGNAVPSEYFDNLESIDDDRPFVVIKFHRLGRTSFRKVKEKREYHNHRSSCSWLYLDRLAAKREYEVMNVLYNNGLPVPRPIANNRNAVVMEYLDKSVPLCQVPNYFLKSCDAYLSKKLYKKGIKILSNCVEIGLVHGDFNEFNLLVTHLPSTVEEEQLTCKDFTATQYDRDVDGFMGFFAKYFDVNEFEGLPEDIDDIERKEFLDVEIKAPGHPKLSKHKIREVTENVRDSSEFTDSESELSNSKSDEEELSGSEILEVRKRIKNYLLAENIDKKCRLKHDKNAVISKEEIKNRHRKEKTREDRAKFNANVKKQARVGRKTKFRENLKGEIDLFGL